MPSKLPRPCSHPGCPALTKERYCPAHKRQVAQAYNRERGTAAQRGYDARWRRIRAQVLADEPLCRQCASEGRVVAAKDVDHIDGNAKNMVRSNLRPLCHPCHSRKTIAHDGGFGR